MRRNNLSNEKVHDADCDLSSSAEHSNNNEREHCQPCRETTRCRPLRAPVIRRGMQSIRSTNPWNGAGDRAPTSHGLFARADFSSESRTGRRRSSNNRHARPAAHLRPLVAGRSFGPVEDPIANLEFIFAAIARQDLDRLPVSIPRREILPGINTCGICAQTCIDQAGFLVENGPFDRRKEAQTSDAIADRHLVGGLPLPFAKQ